MFDTLQGGLRRVVTHTIMAPYTLLYQFIAMLEPKIEAQPNG